MGKLHHNSIDKASRPVALSACSQGFMGPNYSISTACATANYAFVAAANHIRQGDCDIVVVSPPAWFGMCTPRRLAPA